MVTRADLIDYHRLRELTDRQARHAELAAESALAAGLTPVEVEVPAAGAGRKAASTVVPGWADPSALAEAPRGHHRITLLSPFDSLLWDRKRTRRMFGFEHSLEAYVPRAKRVHGYYTMPLLAGGRLSAGSIRSARVRRWSPGSSRWTRPPPSRRWPGPCVRLRSGWAARRSRSGGSTARTSSHACAMPSRMGPSLASGAQR